MNAEHLLHLLLPKRCAACDCDVFRGFFCPVCVETLVPGSDACCTHCGELLLDLPSEVVATCHACLLRPPPFARGRAAFAYGGALQVAIARWKNQRLSTLGDGLCQLMVSQAERAGWDRPERGLVVVPIPTPFRRAIRRGFNPAGHLAKALATHLRRPCRPDGLKLLGGLARSQGLGRASRVKRMTQAFEGGSWVQGVPILLVDDVRTTGATCRAASRALKRAGAARVDVALLASVPA